ncbi:hypothetical protein N7448_001860 [Penicillium atrosanguineum]|uniref:NmrA-like domain-containing protein n=1 Tax=Penicillium atrosanguineum TaxID=1132637 RepID=A0A9W9Q5N2_9EURO|nr:Protein bfr2 [Penicillium atrosanguineum]KAJ5133111.1 hypothetical protein N7526_004476 [Penicillium atrosanguineum]KAJ5150282.1 hypothetical protein N7448_001860 [Penicillium atrosanguineum]KAJ5305598.1 Protein bfr2 [Penicillium atrosanguineum]KAJ5325060.1 hypothetical protein N7476_003660 [Penicillium atrosanguineum]
MTKILVVFGATGQQGGSVIDAVLNDSELSKEYSLRAITRDIKRPSAQSLQSRGVEVVEADVDDPDSLSSALAQAHTVFIVTISIYDENLKARELRQTKDVADAAVAAGAQYLIYSSCVAAERLWGIPVTAFDSKADSEAYIRTLPIKSAFFSPGMFMQNYLTNQRPQPIPGKEGDEITYAIANFISPDAPIPLIDTVKDSGKYVGTILANPDRYAGNTFFAATAFYSYREAAEIITRITGKRTVYLQIPLEQWISYLPPGYDKAMSEMMRWVESPGYFGPQSNEEVKWTVQQVKDKLSTFEEFVESYATDMF